MRISDWSSDVCSSDLGYRAIGERVAAAVPKLFSTVPEAPLEIRPVPSYIEKTSAGAYYMAGTPDGSRPGIFYFNSYDLPSRTTPGMETLYLHEAVRSEEHTSELQSLMRISYAVFCLKKKKYIT